VAYLHNAVFGQKYLHYQCRMGKERCLTARTNCPLLEIVATPETCASAISDNPNIESTVDSDFQAQILLG
jgi:hypothetical protein